SGRLQELRLVLDEQLSFPHRHAQLGERRVRVPDETPERLEGLPDLPDGDPRFEEASGHPEADQVAKVIRPRRIPRLEQTQAPQLVGAARGQGEEPDDAPLREDPARRRQCRKCRPPVRTIAIPNWSAAATTSSSRIEPPGWMTAATPASATTSSPSRKG